MKRIAAMITIVIASSIVFLLESPEARAQSVRSSAAFCSQFKDYDQQTECLKNQGKSLADDVLKRCERFADKNDIIECLNAATSQESDRKPWCLPVKMSDTRKIAAGQKVVIKGIDGCSMIFN